MIQTETKPNQTKFIWFGFVSFELLFGLVWFEKYWTKLICFSSNFFQTKSNYTIMTIDTPKE